MGKIPAAVNGFIISPCKSAASAGVLIRYKRYKAVFRLITFKSPSVIDNIYMKVSAVKNIAFVEICTYFCMIFKKEFFSPERTYNNGYIYILYAVTLGNKSAAVKTSVIGFKCKICIVIFFRKHISEFKSKCSLVIKHNTFC